MRIPIPRALGGEGKDRISRRTEVITRLPDGVTDKPPLVFVHGLAAGAWVSDEHWLPAAAARGFPAHAVSLPGHGDSDGAEQLRRYRFSDYRDAVLQVLAELPEPAVLIGHSMGAYVVAQVLTRYTARAGVLLAPVGPWPALLPTLSIVRRYPQDVLAMLLGRRLPLHREQMYPHLDPETAEGYLSRLDGESPLVQYQFLLHRPPGRPSGNAPVLVAGSSEDTVIPPADVRLTARYYGVQPLLWDGIGHELFLDAGWERPLNAVLDWVERTTGPG